MTNAEHGGHLGDAYGASEPDEIAKVYDRWADTYDAEMAASGYRHPSICLALMARYLPRGSEPVLDAGAGTGLIGEWLKILGYTRIEALDISSGMLAIAEKKNVYSAFHNIAMGGALPFETGAYAGIVSAGVFTSGHVGAESVDELIRVCRPGGVIVLTVKNTLWDEAFADHLMRLERDARVKCIEQTVPYVSMPGEAGTVPSRGIALSVL